MTTLIAIMAHQEAASTFQRHWPFWLANAGKADALMVFSPEDNQVFVPGIQCLTFGRKEHNGVESIKRFYSILDHVNGLGFDRIAFFEYDSFALTKLPEQTADIIGNIFIDEASAQFEGGMFIHPPFLVSAVGLGKLVKAMKSIPFTAEGSFWDRWLGLAVKRAGLTHKSLIGSGEGYSHNTIHKEHHEGLRKAIIAGATLIHGCKDEACLKVVREAQKLLQSEAHLLDNGYQVVRPA